MPCACCEAALHDLGWMWSLVFMAEPQEDRVAPSKALQRLLVDEVPTAKA